MGLGLIWQQRRPNDNLDFPVRLSNAPINAPKARGRIDARSSTAHWIPTAGDRSIVASGRYSVAVTQLEEKTRLGSTRSFGESLERAGPEKSFRGDVPVLNLCKELRLYPSGLGLPDGLR